MTFKHIGALAATILADVEHKKGEAPNVAKVLVPPHNALSTVCTDVSFDDPGLVELGEVLLSTMFAYQGKGLSAPQIGVTKRMFCMRYDATGNAVVMCNPVMLRHGRNKVTDTEGCLSLPGRRLRVERYRICDVEWYSPTGEYHKATMCNNDARCVQHEIDHLNGKLIA